MNLLQNSHIVKRLADVGVDHCTREEVSLRIRRLNLFSVAHFFLALVFSAVAILLGLRTLFGMALLTSLVFFLPVILNQFRLFEFSRVFFLISISAVVTIYSLLLGRDSGIHYGFFAAATLPLMVYTYEELLPSVLGSAMPLILFGLLELTNLRPAFGQTFYLAEPQAKVYSLMVFMISMTVTLIVVHLAVRQESHALREKIAMEKRLAISTKMATLGELSSCLSHEISTPLTVINSGIEYLQDELAREELDRGIVSETLKTIETSVGRVLKIMRALRSMTRNSENDPLAPVAFGRIIENVQALVAPKCRDNSVKLMVVAGPDIQLNCRQVEMEQVLLNLINNSIDAIQVLAEKWVRVDLSTDGVTIQIAVTDSGGGISPSIAPQIMEPFFTTKAVGQGTGIGLSFCKKIIEQHGGTLTLDHLSAHTRFVIALPAATNS